LRGAEVVVRDLNSTNGTYIGGEKVTESVLKAGQILRLGQVQMRLELDAPGAPGKTHFDRTMVIPGGVTLTELEQGARGAAFDTRSAGFSKKDNRINEFFIALGAGLGLVIVALLIYILISIRR
jgi:FHA domain